MINNDEIRLLFKFHWIIVALKLLPCFLHEFNSTKEFNSARSREEKPQSVYFSRKIGGLEWKKQRNEKRTTAAAAYVFTGMPNSIYMIHLLLIERCLQAFLFHSLAHSINDVCCRTRFS